MAFFIFSVQWQKYSNRLFCRSQNIQQQKYFCGRKIDEEEEESIDFQLYSVGEQENARNHNTLFIGIATLSMDEQFFIDVEKRWHRDVDVFLSIQNIFSVQQFYCISNCLSEIPSVLFSSEKNVNSTNERVPLYGCLCACFPFHFCVSVFVSTRCEWTSNSLPISSLNIRRAFRQQDNAIICYVEQCNRLPRIIINDRKYLFN